MNSPAEQISLGKRLRALQLQQAIQLLHTSKALTSPPLRVRHITIANDTDYILTILTNALQGRGTVVTPSLQASGQDPAARHTEAQRQLCEYLHGLTGIEARIAPHGNGHAVHLD